MSPRTATLTNNPVEPGQGGYRGTVTIQLNTPAFTADGAREIIGRTTVHPGPSGQWSVTLPINDDLDPAGTSYTVREASGVIWTLQLTAAHAGQTVNLRDVLVEDPANPNTVIAGVTTAALNAAVAGLVNAAPSTLDTLGELATQLASDESAATALTTTVGGKLAKAANLSDLASAAAARTNLGLGTAATHPAGDFATPADLSNYVALSAVAEGADRNYYLTVGS